MERVYFDYAASAPLRPEAKAKFLECLDLFGNPSSVHAEGQAARNIMDDSRRLIADLLGVRAERIVFTSGATEANNLALRGVMAKAGGKRLLVSAVEHDCVRNTGIALGAFELPVDRHGLVKMDVLAAELAKGDVALVSVMHANNENGVLQDIEEIGKIVRAAGAFFHTDAVQTVGHVAVAVGFSDLMSFSAHKFGGPKGAGVLVLKGEIEMDAVLTGGGQERNRRAGTENVLAVGSMGAAMAAAFEKMGKESALSGKMLADMRSGVEALGLEIAGGEVAGVGHILQVLTPGRRGEDVVIGMDLKGVAVSQGSACGSGRVKESHVLRAMGYDGGRAGEAIRLSWGWDSKPDEVGVALGALRGLVV